MIITLTAEVSKTCPFKNEQDIGLLSIQIAGEAPELHHLGEQVVALSASPVSHEEYTRKIVALLPPDSVVTTTWKTGIWGVEVTEG